MLMLNNSLIDVPVMSLQSGGQLGATLSPILDPRKLQIYGFYVGGPRIHETSVLHVSDIREVGPLGIIVNSADDIMVADDGLVRLQEVVDLKFELIGKTVIDDTKKKLGKVTEYSIDTEGFFVQKLHVGQSLMKNLTNSSLVIGRSQIKQITDTSIIVSSASIPETTGLAQLINPFRKSPGSIAAD